MARLILVEKSRSGEGIVSKERRENNFQGIHWQIIQHSYKWRPPTDVYETENEVVVRVEIAGMNGNDFAITLDGQLLIIRGIRKDDAEKRAYQQMEINFGFFIIQVNLPCLILSEQIVAEYQEGFLKVILPKAEPQRIWIDQ
ncbi:MAG TPA: Hsp20/alpha crystallin family protein [Anaerolineae bacterium]|nr:Hsp20/alpha crystallin family protein [Anaerolineae bacterium]